jgi:Hemerythrin HHE cation binding domain
MKRASDATPEDRRQFLRTALSATGLALVGCATARATRGGEEMNEGEGGEAEVTPGEDLMQEHGVLERILLIYDEADARIDRSAPLDVTIVAKAAAIIRRFVENYHEKLEEEFVFPRLQAAGREADLVEVLLRQHARGRELTDDIVRNARGGAERELAPILFGEDGFQAVVSEVADLERALGIHDLASFTPA